MVEGGEAGAHRYCSHTERTVGQLVDLMVEHDGVDVDRRRREQRDRPKRDVFGRDPHLLNVARPVHLEGGCEANMRKRTTGLSDNVLATCGLYQKN